MPDTIKSRTERRVYFGSQSEVTATHGREGNSMKQLVTLSTRSEQRERNTSIQLAFPFIQSKTPD